eukprot:gene39347-53195_t
MLACHAGAPGSIPGWCIRSTFYFFVNSPSFGVFFIKDQNRQTSLLDSFLFFFSFCNGRFQIDVQLLLALTDLIKRLDWVMSLLLAAFVLKFNDMICGFLWLSRRAADFVVVCSAPTRHSNPRSSQPANVSESRYTITASEPLPVQMPTATAPAPAPISYRSLLFQLFWILLPQHRHLL